MKKMLWCLVALVAAAGLSGCGNRENEAGNDPTPANTYLGDWYCYEMNADARLKLDMMIFDIDTAMVIDTTFATPQRYQLTADNYLISGDKDTVATYTYDEKESQLVIATDRLLRETGIDPQVAAIIGFPAQLRADFSYNAETAKGKIDYEAEKSIKESFMTLSYAVRIKGNMYLKRNKY